MNPFKTIKYQLYLLQLENYELGRYWKLIFKKGLFLPKTGLRKGLVWTNKAKALFMMALGMHLLLSIIISRAGFDRLWLVFFILLFLAFSLLYVLFFSLALLLVSPADYIMKQAVIRKARRKIESLDKLKVIGIAGSYGKTTMKEVVGAVLGTQYSVLSTPESINTPVGIARWIIKNLDERTEIAIIEMGEHYKGDIEDICKIAAPDIAVITGINEAHLERMKSINTIVSTIFEIAANAKQGASIVLNGDDQNVMDHYKEFVWPDHRIEKFQISNLKFQKFSTEQLCWEGEAEGLGKISVNLLGEYALGDVDAAVKIGRLLGMKDEEIKKGILNIKPVEHRLQPMAGQGNVLVIDDSYNANPKGVAEAINVLARFKDRRKIFITPGMVETGKKAAELHREIGRQLAGVADVAILIRNSVTPWIEEGINSYVIANPSAAEGEAIFFSDKIASDALAMTAPQVVWFSTAQEAFENLKTILKPGDVVMFQNDWGDQYV